MSRLVLTRPGLRWDWPLMGNLRWAPLPGRESGLEDIHRFTSCRHPPGTGRGSRGPRRSSRRGPDRANIGASSPRGSWPGRCRRGGARLRWPRVGSRWSSVSTRIGRPSRPADPLDQLADRDVIAPADVDRPAQRRVAARDRDEARDRILDVGQVAPRVEPAQPDAGRVSAWLMIVGMIARADCRGPKVLNGRRIVTGRPKAR